MNYETWSLHCQVKKTFIALLLTEKKTDQKRAEKLLKSVKNHQNWTFLATYTPDMVIIWPHMACLPMFLSHTTYTSHILPHMGSNDRQIAVNRGFSGENLPCSRL